MDWRGEKECQYSPGLRSPDYLGFSSLRRVGMLFCTDDEGLWYALWEDSLKMFDWGNGQGWSRNNLLWIFRVTFLPLSFTGESTGPKTSLGVPNSDILGQIPSHSLNKSHLEYLVKVRVRASAAPTDLQAEVQSREMDYVVCPITLQDWLERQEWTLEII